MKRVLFLLLSSLFVGNTMAQTSPVASTNREIRTKNYYLLCSVVERIYHNKDWHQGEVVAWERWENTPIRIPLYLSTIRDATIKYYWYRTKMVFGEEIRISEEPEYIEEGTYVNGRLTMYKTETEYSERKKVYQKYRYGEWVDINETRVVFCKFNWSDNGEIMSVDKYNADGDLIRSYKSENYNVEPKALSDERPTIRSDDRFGVFNADNKVRCEYFEL